jgi:rare lipoprotein A
MKRVLAAVLAIGMLVASIGAAPVEKNSSAPPKPGAKIKVRIPKPYQVGRASWYGKQFDGRDTASGERYDMFQLTAAHLTLPLGTMVRVTNLRNSKSVVVRINDRGPMVVGRIIDLSYGAARMLQLAERGVEKVRLDVLGRNDVILAENLPPTP